MKRVTIFTVVILLITVSSLMAEFRPKTFYLGGNFSAIQLRGGNEHSEVKASLGLDLNYFFTQRVGMEFSAAMGWTRPGTENPEESFITYLYPITASMKFNFLKRGPFIPYGVAGLGILYWDVRDVTTDSGNYSLFEKRGHSIHSSMQKDAIANVGLGFHLFLSKYWALESGMRYKMILESGKDMSGFGDGHTGLWEIRMGIGHVFGGTKVILEKERADRKKQAIIDSDKFDAERQAKLDSEKKQRETQSKLDTNVQEQEKQAKLELERKEKERLALIEAEKMEKQKQANLEAARIEKERQVKLETERKEKAALLEAQLSRDIVSQTVFFLTGGSKIAETEKTKLLNIAQVLKANPTIVLELQGYSDITGTRELNMKLTKERADSVRTFLIDNGIEPNRLKSVGYGPDTPISPNDTASGRARNRRVEFKILQ
jgi:outer membrane protein OmpA-like peptidoglycan-associated protein/outer membrane protein W